MMNKEFQHIIENQIKKRKRLIALLFIPFFLIIAANSYFILEETKLKEGFKAQSKRLSKKVDSLKNLSREKDTIFKVVNKTDTIIEYAEVIKPDTVINTDQNDRLLSIILELKNELEESEILNRRITDANRELKKFRDSILEKKKRIKPDTTIYYPLFDETSKVLVDTIKIPCSKKHNFRITKYLKGGVNSINKRFESCRFTHIDENIDVQSEISFDDYGVYVDLNLNEHCSISKIMNDTKKDSIRYELDMIVKSRKKPKRERVRLDFIIIPVE